jgi:hypothetical protein
MPIFALILPITVPEPSSIAELAIAILAVGLAAVIYRRRKHA